MDFLIESKIDQLKTFSQNDIGSIKKDLVNFNPKFETLFKIVDSNTTEKYKKFWELEKLHTSLDDFTILKVDFIKLLSNIKFDPKKYYLIQMDDSGGFFDLEPGDAFGVIPPNKKSMIERILQNFNTDWNLKISVDNQPDNFEYSIGDYISYKLDIMATPKKINLPFFSQFLSPNDALFFDFIYSKLGSDFYFELKQSFWSFYDIFCKFFNNSSSSILISLLKIVPEISPRFYSCCNDPKILKNKIQFCFSVSANGLCAPWMESFFQSDNPQCLVCVPRKVNIFRLPSIEIEIKRPLIMIGIGAGVSPFIGFLARLEGEMKNDFQFLQPRILYFGCRNDLVDNLFKDEFNNFLKNGTLDKLRISFSRPDISQIHQKQQNGQYVQDYMIEDSDYLFELIFNQNAFVYFCGDGVNIAKDIQNAIEKILSQHNVPNSKKYIQQMTKEKRYIQDIW